MITMLKIRNGLIYILTELPIVTFNTSQTRGNNCKLNLLQARTNLYAKLFPDSVKLWNSLPKIFCEL